MKKPMTPTEDNTIVDTSDLPSVYPEDEERIREDETLIEGLELENLPISEEIPQQPQSSQPLQPQPQPQEEPIVEEETYEEEPEQRESLRGSVPGNTFTHMNVEELVGKLREEANMARSENYRLIEQVSMDVIEIRNLRQSVATYKGLANTESAILSNALSDTRRMTEIVGKNSSESMTKDLALRQLGGEVAIKDQVIERIQGRLGELLSMDELEKTMEIVMEAVGWSNQLSPRTPTQVIDQLAPNNKKKQ